MYFKDKGLSYQATLNGNRTMLPTPSTSHVNTNRIYDPAEDSFLLLDTLSSKVEVEFLKNRFVKRNELATGDESLLAPLILEVGTGSGVVLAFATAHAKEIFGRDILSLGTDINWYACQATEQTVRQTCLNNATNNAIGMAKSFNPLAILNADLTAPIRSGMIDVLIFNPPYVPTSGLPRTVAAEALSCEATLSTGKSTFEDDSDMLALSYAGGVDGMEVTSRLLDQIPFILSKPRGVAYVLLCGQNKPDMVVQQIRQWGPDWAVSVVGHSGKTGGWEKLQIVRICRVTVLEAGNNSLPEP